MKRTFWIKESVLNKIDWIIACNVACDKWMHNNMDEISLFYSYFSITEHRKFVKEITDKINLDLSGIGLEIGSGPGILSNSLIKIFKNIKKIYLLDKAPNTYNLMKKVAEENNTLSKLECIIGSFNQLNFEENSLDFVLDFDSIHHSEDIDLTFKEISRVLKPGGLLVCFDRAQPNYTSKNQIEAMLEIEYSDEYKLENNIPLNKVITRRNQGETEPYLRDWTNAAEKYNMDYEVYIFHKKTLMNFLRSIYGFFIPFNIKKILGKGINITTHYQILLSYIGIKKFFINKIKVFGLNYNAKSKRSPQGKMVFLFKKK